MESNSHNEGVECDEKWWRGKTLPGLRLVGGHTGRDAGGGGRAGRPPATAEQEPSRWTGSGTDKHCVQRWSQTQRTSFTTVVSTFRLPKIPFTDWLSLIKRMSPRSWHDAELVLPRRALHGRSAGELSHGAAPLCPCPPAPCQWRAGQAAALPPNAPPRCRHRAKEENFTPFLFWLLSFPPNAENAFLLSPPPPSSAKI